jgi:fructose-1,6-bisphosphatase class II
MLTAVERPLGPSLDTDIDIESELSLELVRVVEAAAVCAARTMGQADPMASDGAAVQAMRAAFDRIPIAGRIVIGEGERDEAPMLYIGEAVGAPASEHSHYPTVDIAVDPLEGTSLCASGASNAIAVLAASERGGLLHAPDCYMEKIICGPACRGTLDIDAPVEQNLNTIARCLEREVEDLVVVVMDRPRHQELIQSVRKAGARIRLISDGDLAAGIAAAVRGTGVHAVMGIGGAPEGVITAAAIRCLHGEMLGRLVAKTPEVRERMQGMGIRDCNKIYTAAELAPGRRMIFAASGVTHGALLNGVRFFGGGHRTHSVVMTLETNTIRFLDTVHVTGDPGPRGVRLN